LILLVQIPLVQAESDNLSGVKVAVYNGTGEMDSSRIALVHMFEWMGATVVEVNASQVLGDFLDDCDILVFPGGSETSYWSDLQHSTGLSKIRDFVEHGGSYFGICGGSTFGATYVDLFNGTMSPTNEPGDIIHLEPMFPNRTSTGPDLVDCPINFTTMYYASQYFIPNEGVNNIHVVATYESGKAGMIAFEYGYGTVFLSSPHPEYEENDDRDATSEFDYLDDPDSEWDFLLRISQWLVDASSDPPPETETTTTSESNTTSSNTSTNAIFDLQVAGFATAGILVLVVVLTMLYRKTH